MNFCKEQLIKFAVFVSLQLKNKNFQIKVKVHNVECVAATRQVAVDMVVNQQHLCHRLKQKTGKKNE